MLSCKKHIYRAYSFLLIWSFTIQSLHAQTNIKFEHYGLAEGLSQVTVNGITQDSLGYIWLATQDGLNRFNGHDFKVFKDNDSTLPILSSNQIFSIYNNTKNQLWTGLSEGILNLYSFKNNEFIKVKLPVNSKIQTLAEFNKDTLLAGTDNRIYLINTTTFDISLLATLSGIVNEMKVKNNMIWTGTSKGFYKIDLYKGGPKKLIYDINITSIKKYKNTWLIGTDKNGLTVFDEANESLKPFNISLSLQFILDIHIDNQQRIWVGTEGDGLYIYDQDTYELSHFTHDINDPYSISNNRVRSIFEDRNGIIWIGTDSNGFCKYAPHTRRFKILLGNPLQYNISSNRTWVMHEDVEHNLWIGTDGGLIKYNRLNDRNHFFTFSATNPLVNSVRTFLYTENVLWLGTEDGLIEFDTQTFNFSRIKIKDNTAGLENRIRSIYKLSNNKLLIGTLGGLFTWNRSTGLSTKNESIAGSIWTIMKGKDNQLWVGTDTGLYLTDYQLSIIKTLSRQDGLSHNEVHQLYEDEEGTLWITTYGGGINRYNPKTESIKVIDKNAGLPTNACSCVMRSGDDLWISTINGFAKYALNTEKTTLYHLSEGLQGVGFNVRSCYKNKAGELFFGGTDGINYFNPEEFREDTYTGKIALEDIRINGHSISKKGTQINNALALELPYDSNNFQIEFAALNYSIPDKNQYSYKLEGYDAEWSNTGQSRTVLYRKISPGEYNFLIKTANHDGNWSASQKVLSMVISPPWWQTIWANITYTAVLLLAIFSYVRYRTRHIQGQKIILEDKIKERTAKLKQVNEEVKTQNDYIAEQNNVLKANEEKLRHAHLIAKMGGWEYDVVNNKPHWYREVLHVFDLPFNETPTSEEYLSVIHPDDRKLFLARQHNLITKQEPYEEVIRHRSKSGKYLYMRIIAKPFIENGRVTKILGTAMNVTDRIESESRYERMGKTKDMILATVAHDLRSPINAIRGMINLLKIDDTLTAKERNEIIKMMEDSADKGLELIAELLEYSEIQNENFKIDLKKLNVNNYIEETVDYMMHNYHDPRIHLHLDTKDVSAKIDKKQLSRVIENLLNNARKFTPEDGTIEISTYEKGEFLVVKIEDTGIGIPDKLKPIIFERFSDARRAGLKGEKSTGLGMSIVKRIVDLHEGKIWFESEENAGTTFYIGIPVVRKNSSALSP